MGVIARLVRNLAALAVIVCMLGLAACQTGPAGGPLTRPTNVPQWDARGPMVVPWQGISCADLTADGRYTAVGTTAPPGDWHSFLLDANGIILEQDRTGERWVGAVAAGKDGNFLAEWCINADGTSGDHSIVGVFSSGKSLERASDPINRSTESWPFVFHYGDHSNHMAMFLQGAGESFTFGCENCVMWDRPAGDANGKIATYMPLGPGHLSAMASNAAGKVVVGKVVCKTDDANRLPGLMVLDKAKVLWTRPMADDVEPPPALEAGVYAPSVHYEDGSAWAPLSTAVDASGTRIASADYQGWQRRFTPKAENPIRFMPTRPTIHVYDANGAAVRRFGPETFSRPFWADLLFTPNGKKLLAFGHSWNCCCLAGQPRLPADKNFRSLYVLDLAGGLPDVIEFPDAISSVAAAGNGKVVVGCWDRRVYILDINAKAVAVLPKGIDVGAASLVRVSADGSRILVAGADGVVRMLDGSGGEMWKNDLNQSAPAGNKPWLKNQKMGPRGPGVWRIDFGRTPSDLGHQYLIEGEDGLILLEANAGLSIEKTWEQIKSAGLDPMKVKYVIVTHEHGDHAPGAYLWRVLTGAQIVATPEVAYTLQHHLPWGTGYGFHPAQKVDIVIREDCDMTLAGVKFKMLRLPGHTYGSMGFVCYKNGKKYESLGDLIMPGGALGYSGSLGFSAQQVLDSLKKLDSFGPDFILGGHGEGSPGDYIGKGIAAGEATGWNRMAPVKPGRLYGMTQKNYLVVDWLDSIAGAGFGDVEGRGCTDVLTVCRDGNAAALKVFLNKNGRFDDKPDLFVPLPEDMLNTPKIRVFHLHQGGGSRDARTQGEGVVASSRRDFATTAPAAGKAADIFVAGESHAFLLEAEGDKPMCRTVDLGDVHWADAVPCPLGGGTGLVAGVRFSNCFMLAMPAAGGKFRMVERRTSGAYMGLRLVDIAGDGNASVVTACGDIFTPDANGDFPQKPSMKLDTGLVPSSGWVYLAAGDFRGAGRPDLAFLGSREGFGGLIVNVFYNTGDPKEPYHAKPDKRLELPGIGMLRDGPTVADWNGDGIDDLVLSSRNGVIILLGSKQGLDGDRSVRLKLDYSPHYDTRLGVADFTGDGKADLAGWGPTGVGACGVYIWLQQ